jgi:hypothetical protein
VSTSPANTTDREKAGLRGPAKLCVEETTYNTGKSLRTTEYSLDGRLLMTHASNPDGSEWVTTQSYDVEGRLLTKRFTSPGFSDLVTSRSYDAAGRLVQIIKRPWVNWMKYRLKNGRPRRNT